MYGASGKHGVAALLQLCRRPNPLYRLQLPPQKAGGFPKAIVNAIRKSGSKGHRLKAAGGEGRLCTFWCTNCGSHARTVPRGLAGKCNGVPSKAGAWALQLTRQGRDPLDGSVFELQYDIGELNSQ